VRLVNEPAGCRSNYWLQTLALDEALADQRNAVLTATNDAGLMTRPVWDLMHRMPFYRNSPMASLPVAESLWRRLINIPSNPASTVA
jgi:perosamine synthetase